MAHERDFAIGWSEIAAHLKVSRSTAIRWGRDRGMPLTYEGGRPLAPRASLDAWRRLLSA